MLLPAFYLITAAILLGLYLSLFYLGLIQRRSWIVSVLHGVLGAAGLVVLRGSLGGPPRGAEFGVQSFGSIAANIALGALILGLAYIALLRFANKRMTWIIGLHATVALTAYAFLLAYVTL